METTREIIFIIANIINIISMIIVLSISTAIIITNDWGYFKRNKLTAKIYNISLLMLFFAVIMYLFNFILVLNYREQEKNSKNLPKYEQITYPIYKKIN